MPPGMTCPGWRGAERTGARRSEPLASPARSQTRVVAASDVDNPLPYGPIFAGSVVAILPVVIVVLIFKRNVISGLTAGAIK